MPSNEPDPPPADPRTIVRTAPGASLAASTPPTFPSEAESLLNLLKLGAARSGPAPPAEQPPAPADAAAPFPLVPGYEIECELGRGGMGVVYKARHAALRHTVAIKMILASAHAAPAEVARFVAEAEAVAAVKHPNVVQVFDLGVSGESGPNAGRPYFVMEYAGGGTLAARLKEGGPLDCCAAAELIEAVARGVHAANDAGIVHRDLKPANILLSAERGARSSDQKTEPKSEPPVPSASDSALRAPHSALTPKVSDFGLAKRLSSDLTRSQAVMGTPAYMAPEQAGGKAKFVGPQADVYALGVILYQCLTGAVPFDDPDPWALIGRVLEAAPEPPSRRAAGVPRDLELICLKCLEKEPHHRYPSAAALADDLHRFLNREPVSVRPLGTPTRLYRWARKRPAIAALWAVGLALVVAVPAVVVGVRGELKRESEVTAEARQTAIEARRAEEEANRARAATEELARSNELFALLNRLRTRASERPLGWTAANLNDVTTALALARGDPVVVADLRSDAADALLAPDLFPVERVAKGMTGCALATDPKTGLVAVGEFKGRGACRVLLIDPATGRVARTLTYETPLFIDAQDGTRALAFSPDARRLFVGTRGSRVLGFDLDAPANRPAWERKAADKAVEQLAASPDGKTVYAACGSGPVLAWDAATGAPRPPLKPDGGAEVRAVAVLPAGDVLATAGGLLYRWRADGTRVFAHADAPGHRMAVAGGSLLLVADGALLRAVDRDTGAVTDQFPDPNLRVASHEQYIKAIALHPSGAFAATAAGDRDRTVKVWELASGRLVGTLVSPGTDPIALAWSADGRFLLATSAGHVSRWKFVPPAAQRFECFSAHAIEAAALFGDRAAALTAPGAGRRELRFGADGTLALPDGGGNGRPGVAAGPGGTLVVTRSAPGVVHWRPGTPVPPPGFAQQIAWCPRFTPDGGAIWAVVDAREIRSFDPPTGAPRGKWRNSLGEVVSGLASFDALAVGRTLAVAAGPEGTVMLLDPNTCEPTASFRPAGGPVLSVAVAPDDSLVAAGTQQGKLRLIRTADRAELPAVAAHPRAVAAVAINRDGTLVATGSRDRSVRLWKRTGDRLEPLGTVSDLPAMVRDLQFSPTDGRLLVLLTNEHAVRVWDVDRLNTQLAELKLGW